MSLTDDWNNKKFKTGQRFFISINKGKPEPATVDMDGDFVDMEGMPINSITNEIEVLALCDYEELQNLKLTKYMAVNIACSATEENKKLRDLLKDCKKFLENEGYDVYSWSKFAEPEDTLLTRISIAINESEKK